VEESMLSTRGIETRSAKLVAAVVAVLALATAIIVLSSARADALPCDPQVQDCNSGGGTSTIRVTLSVTNNQPDRGKITSSDNRINCGLGNTDCSQLYSYTVTCDGLGDCSTPDYATVSLSPTSASGLALSA
jgi:hypothetical protein